MDHPKNDTYELFKSIAKCRQKTHVPAFICLPVMYEVCIASSCGLIDSVTSPIDRH